MGPSPSDHSACGLAQTTRRREPPHTARPSSSHLPPHYFGLRPRPSSPSSRLSATQTIHWQCKPCRWCGIVEDFNCGPNGTQKTGTVSLTHRYIAQSIQCSTCICNMLYLLLACQPPLTARSAASRRQPPTVTFPTSLASVLAPRPPGSPFDTLNH